MSEGEPGVASLRGAIALAVSLGQADREAAELALEHLDSSEEGAASVAQVAFLLDLGEDVVAELARLASERPDEAAAGSLRSRLFGAHGTPSAVTVADLRAAAARDVSLTGRTIDGFEIGELLGEGGMGRVYRARQAAVHRDVALKVLPAHRVGDAEAVQRFLREGRSAAAISHAHVVTCHGMGRSGDHLWVAMELLPGGDLEARVKRMGGKLPERRALAIARDACEGLAAIEAAGLVHRDVKPANVFLTAAGRAKIGDLGLACSRLRDDRVTRTGLVVGTPAYMAPEQAEGAREPDARADVYALGATLWRLLAGRPPFEGSELSVLRAKLDAPPPDPRGVEPSVSASTAKLVMRAMARRPEDRPANAAAFLAEIDAATRALDAEPRRQPWVLPVVVACVAGVAAIVWTGLGHVRREGHESAPGMREVALPSILRPASGSFARAQDGAFVVDPGDEDWRRTGFFDAGERRLPVHARFRVTSEVARDAPAGVLSEQGFRRAGGFFHEVGVRGENSEIAAGADLRGFALWLTLVVDERGGAQGLLRAVGPGKPAGVLAQGTPGTAVLDDFTLDDARDLDVELDLDASGWRFRALRGGAVVREGAGPWSSAAQGPGRAPPEPLYLWAHAGNWASGRGRGSSHARAGLRGENRPNGGPP